jgi:hypothetical protein
MKRHIHRWKKVRGLHVASEHEFCDVVRRGHRCKARRGYQEWNSCDQALWYVGVRIGYLTWAVGLETVDMDFFNLWSLSILRDDRS